MKKLVQFRLRLRPQTVNALRIRAARLSDEQGRYVSWCSLARGLLETLTRTQERQ